MCEKESGLLRIFLIYINIYINIVCVRVSLTGDVTKAAVRFNEFFSV